MSSFPDETKDQARNVAKNQSNRYKEQIITLVVKNGKKLIFTMEVLSVATKIRIRPQEIFVVKGKLTMELKKPISMKHINILPIPGKELQPFIMDVV